MKPFIARGIAAIACILLAFVIACPTATDFLPPEDAQAFLPLEPAELPVDTPLDEAKEEMPPETPEETPPEPLEPEQIVALYFESLYGTYIEMEDNTEVMALLDMNVRHNHIFLRWISAMNQRRRLIDEYDFCYVEKRELPYTITFLNEDELEDERMQSWMEMGVYGVGVEDENERLLHFAVTGEAGNAYPPFLAANSQHSMRFRHDGEHWKIVWHYYPGAVRAFRQTNMQLELIGDDEMLELLIEEFAESVPLPERSGSYSGGTAADYALLYTEEKNPDFYAINDWMGNCMNFISQCVWAGLHGGEAYQAWSGRFMDGVWFSGAGGGSPAWENVVHFWNYAAASLRPLYPANVNSLVPGDIAQTRSLSHNGEDERFNHSLLLVDGETLKFAQNSPACFVYYSDLVNTEFRFLRPVG